MYVHKYDECKHVFTCRELKGYTCWLEELQLGSERKEVPDMSL